MASTKELDGRRKERVSFLESHGYTDADEVIGNDFICEDCDRRGTDDCLMKDWCPLEAQAVIDAFAFDSPY